MKRLVFMMALVLGCAAPSSARSSLQIVYKGGDVKSYPTQYCQVYDYGEAVSCHGSAKGGSEIKFVYLMGSHRGPEECFVKFEAPQGSGDWNVRVSGLCREQRYGNKITLYR
jgi:hypothetical protein